jgi:hypothetical protein
MNDVNDEDGCCCARKRAEEKNSGEDLRNLLTLCTCSIDEMRMCKGQKYRQNSFLPVSRESRRNDGTIARMKERSRRSTEEVASPLIMFSLVLSACNHEMYPSLAL